MPDIWTHILCGNDVLDMLDNKWRDIVDEKKNIFNLGCQGPDFFLYNDFWPWIKEKRAVKIGEILHLQKTGDFFVEGLKYLKENITDDENFKVLFAYLLGFICHFGLDRNTHPFIHYYAGVYDKTKPETYKYSGYHKKLELIIDTILLKERKNLESYKYPAYKAIYIGETLPKVIVDFFIYIMNRLYGFNMDIKLVEESYKDMIRVLKIVHDPLGVKKVFLNFIDLFIRDDIDYSGITYPRKINENIDYMNRSHNTWYHPCDKNEIYKYSFDELYDKAVKESINMILGAISFLEGKIKKDNYLSIYFPNISYSTGKPNNEKCELKYYNPIFE